MEKFCPNCEAYRIFTLKEIWERYEIPTCRIEIKIKVDFCDICNATLFEPVRDGKISELLMLAKKLFG